VLQANDCFFLWGEFAVVLAIVASIGKGCNWWGVTDKVNAKCH